MLCMKFYEIDVEYADGELNQLLQLSSMLVMSVNALKLLMDNLVLMRKKHLKIHLSIKSLTMMRIQLEIMYTSCQIHQFHFASKKLQENYSLSVPLIMKWIILNM